MAMLSGSVARVRVITRAERGSGLRDKLWCWPMDLHRSAGIFLVADPCPDLRKENIQGVTTTTGIGKRNYLRNLLIVCGDSQEVQMLCSYGFCGDSYGVSLKNCTQMADPVG